MTQAVVTNEPWIPGGVSEPMSWDPANKVWVSTVAPGSLNPSMMKAAAAGNTAPGQNVATGVLTNAVFQPSSGWTTNAAFMTIGTTGVTVLQAGIYQVSAHAVFAVDAAGISRNLGPSINGGMPWWVNAAPSPSTGGQPVAQFSSTMTLAANTVVGFSVSTDAGTTITFSGELQVTMLGV